jgi:hypothetical protein
MAYRDELAVGIATDAARLPAPLAERLVAGIAERLGARRDRSSGSGETEVPVGPAGLGSELAADLA